MKKVDAIIQQADMHCKAHGARLTAKRKQVLAGLIQSDKALSAYELMDFCQDADGKRIPAMSVYRILEFLEEKNLVHKLKLANKFVACAHISCDHAHSAPQFLICGQCSKVREVSISAKVIADLHNTVEQADFKLMSPQLEMHCLCSACVAAAA